MTNDEIQRRMAELNKKAAGGYPASAPSPELSHERMTFAQQKRLEARMAEDEMNADLAAMSSGQSDLAAIDGQLADIQLQGQMAQAGLAQAASRYDQQAAAANSARPRDREVLVARAQDAIESDPDVQAFRQRVAQLAAAQQNLLSHRTTILNSIDRAQRDYTATSNRRINALQAAEHAEPTVMASAPPSPDSKELDPPLPSEGSAGAKAHEAFVSMGTGWPICEGYVITNHHVVDGASKFTIVRPDGMKMSATVAAKDVVNDLALLKVDDSTKLPPALPVAAKQAGVGEHVFTIGYPLTGVMGTNAKLTDGTVSALTGIDDDSRALQISVPLQHGNSGGPLFNSKGEVIGVVSWKLQVPGDTPENVNYAIKVSYVRALLDAAPQLPTIKVLDAQEAAQQDLAKRVQGSILRVICE